MSWVVASIGLGAGALLSYEKNKVAQNNEKQQMLANAAQDKYSPWTGAAVSVKGPTVGSNTIAGLQGGLQGGLAGYTLGQGINGASATNAGAVPAGQAVGTNALGGTDYANQLGAQSSAFTNSMSPQMMNAMPASQAASAGLMQPQMGSSFNQNPETNTWSSLLVPKQTFYANK